MQSSAFLNNVRSTASQIPRAISPHLVSPTSPVSSASSSIRSISPSRHSFQIRSRSASPSPRRFASVLAYHATPIASPKQHQEESSPEQPHPSNLSDHNRDERNRDESPSRIAVRNLEESWRRFELDAAASPSLSSSSSFGSPGTQSPARVGSPSPLSRPPYKELIECRSLEGSVSEDENSTTRGTARLSKEGQEETLDPKSRMAKQRPAANRLNGQSISAEPNVDNKKRADQQQDRIPAAAKTVDTRGGRTKESRATKQVVSDALYLEQQQSRHGFSSTFLASSEARHILDLPSLLGQDPSRISDVLPLTMPHQPQPRPLSTHTSSSSSTSHLLKDLSAQADATAEAMTERFAAKNLNMTETEAHRMVQILANEVVSLHEEAAKMRAQMDEARRDMLEAARLLRLKAESEQQEHESREMQEYSSSSGPVNADTFVSGEKEPRNRQDEEEHEKQERARVAASSYNKDEWND
ncbi:hypothetical protein EMPS_04027 [Entomortierella parvispora]|uniref:Uncharacterized protein n=1 Tax=Entomortierella parvispora TaxID=205924 RepID=A0A9P3LV56_9FUNG|nr:hypothetical protein EMPS_04027 [Entomortierella parvispora]